MARRHLLGIVVILGLLSSAREAESDVRPNREQPVAAAESSTLSHSEHAYGSLSSLLSFSGWGGHLPTSTSSNPLSADLSGGVGGGVHVAGQIVLRPSFHLGGYASWFGYGGAYGNLSFKMEGLHQMLSIGGSFRTGGSVSRRMSLWFAFDLGPTVLFAQYAEEIPIGVAVFPRLIVDVALQQRGTLKVGAFAALGPWMVPFSSNSFLSKDDGGKLWVVYLMAQLGLRLGT